MHLEKAKEKGFTQDGIDEASWMGISFAGSPNMVFYEQHKDSQGGSLTCQNTKKPNT